jgi:hypothetical protein
MTNAAELLERLRGRGIELARAGDRIRFRPAHAITPEEREALAQHRAEILASLRRERYATRFDGEGPAHAETSEIEDQVLTHGCALLFSTVLHDVIAFIATDDDRNKVPAGFTVYTLAELDRLLPNDGSELSANALRLIHRAKQLGGGSIRSGTDYPETTR